MVGDKGGGGRGGAAGSGGGAGAKRAGGLRLADASLDGTLDHWPPEPPRPPRTPAERTRLALIATPGQVHRLAWSFSDVGRAAKIASSFRRARPSRLDPSATGRFDARAYFDPAERKWRIAARYLLPEPEPEPEPAHRPEHSSEDP